MKVLITGGCSFSECISPWIDTWAKHLAVQLNDYQHISTGFGSQGNGLISRRIIYQLTETLKHVPAEDILVGIMWSGPDRHDFYYHDMPELVQQHTMGNPVKFIPESNNNWVILNHNFNLDIAKLYYTNLHNHVGALIYTYEHILRTQWFLKLNNIKYFMTSYTGQVFPKEFIDHIDVKHLYDQIDFNHFLPVIGEYEWVLEHSKYSFPNEGDPHPGSNQHYEFTQQVILPFLKI